MAAVSAMKTKIYIGGQTPCATKAEYEALPDGTWTQIKGVLNMGEFGPQYEEIAYTAMDEGIVQRLKGALDNGTLALEVRRDPDDPGQTALIAAVDDYENYNFMIELNNKPKPAGSKATRFFLAGKAMAYRNNPADGKKVLTATCPIAIDGHIFEAPKVTGGA